MTRRALLVGINHYQNESDNLRGCINDVGNMRDILKNYLGFRNEDIRMLVDSRATKENIMVRLEWMVRNARSGDVMVFHFSGHGSQIRDRNGDELDDHMDEILCPWDMNWDNGFIKDDDLDRIFANLPGSASLEVFLDCCHSGTGLRQLSESSEPPQSRFLQPPPDIVNRYEGEENELNASRGFASENRSTRQHVLWAGCRSNQTSADAYIEGQYNGAFTYYLCRHMRDTSGNISRKNLIERVQASLRYNDFFQTPQLEASEADMNKAPLQFPMQEKGERLLFLKSPYMRGDDVKAVQSALASLGYDIKADGVFGPYTRAIVIRFQTQKGLLADGIVGPAVRDVLFRRR